MANWSNPLITSQYDVFVNEAKARDDDAATMFLNTPTNQPFGSIRYNRTTNTLQEWNNTSWIDKVIGVAGGGTGASTPAGAVAGLGLGTMASQNSNNVNITGGAAVQNIASMSATAMYISASLGMNCSIGLTADNAFTLGSNAARFARGYFRSGLVIPSGYNMYATS
jgi:hypothetical protein